MQSLNIPWLLVGIVWIMNFAISWWNARSVGLVWSESKMVGGFPRFMVRMGWLMSGLGFSWCYLFVFLVGGYYSQPMFFEPTQLGVELDPSASSVYPLAPSDIAGGFSLGYLIIIPGVLFSGLMIWIHSLIEAWRRRDLPSIGTGLYNTFAQAHNTYNAVRGIPEAIGSVKELFGGKGDGRGKAIMLIILLVVLAIIGGFVTTMSIVGHYAGSRPLNVEEDEEGREFV